MGQAGDEERTFVLFEIAGEACAFPLAEVREVAHLPRLAKAPGMPSAIEGFLNLAGAYLPVLRLDRLFETPEREPGLYTPLIVLEETEPPFAVLADRVLGLRAFPEDAVSPLKETHTFNACADAEIADADGAITVLSAARLLTREERERLAQYQSVAAKRLGALEADPQ